MSRREPEWPFERRPDRPEIDALVCFAKAIQWFREIIEASSDDDVDQITVLSEVGLQRWLTLCALKMLGVDPAFDGVVDALIDEFLSPINPEA